MGFDVGFRNARLSLGLRLRGVWVEVWGVRHPTPTQLTHLEDHGT